MELQPKTSELPWVRRVGSVLVGGSYRLRVTGTPGASSMTANAQDTARRAEILDLVAQVPQFGRFLQELQPNLPPDLAARVDLFLTGLP